MVTLGPFAKADLTDELTKLALRDWLIEQGRDEEAELTEWFFVERHGRIELARTNEDMERALSEVDKYVRDKGCYHRGKNYLVPNLSLHWTGTHYQFWWGNDLVAYVWVRDGKIFPDYTPSPVIIRKLVERTVRPDLPRVLKEVLSSALTAEHVRLINEEDEDWAHLAIMNMDAMPISAEAYLSALGPPWKNFVSLMREYMSIKVED